MKTIRGFRLKLKTLSDLSGFLDDFRSDVTRVLARKWTADVAKHATFAADLASLGMGPKTKDYILAACLKLNEELLQADFRHHSYNCRIDFAFFNGAVLAVFDHGDADYQAAWKRKRPVEYWGWGEDAKRPPNVSEDIWELRSQIWTAVQKKSKFGRLMSFTLLEPPLPRLSWKTVSGHIPTDDQRIENCVFAMLADAKKTGKRPSDEEVARTRDYVARSITKSVTKEFLCPELAEPHARPSGREIKSPITSKKSDKNDKDEGSEHRTDRQRASYIDHADVILAQDGRTFIAVPSVGLATDSRIFVQVGSRSISFKQNGVNYGSVPGIPAAARDHLKSCREAVLVEVEKDNKGRLLRAKFIAIVSDISFGEFYGQSLVGMGRPSRGAAAKELQEWEKTTRQT